MGPSVDTGLAAYEAAQRGSIEPCEAWLEDANRAGLAGADARTREVAVRVVGALARHAALSLNGVRVAELHERMRGLGVEGDAAGLALELVRAWRALLSGEEQRAIELATKCVSSAAEQRDAELVVESTAVAALARLAAGELAEGLRVARRASRMARTEAIPSTEALAHLVLARARRESGHPHLALRITRSLANFQVRSHRAWLAFERGLAGGTELDAVDEQRSGALGAVSEVLRSWVSAAEAGQVEQFDGATRMLQGQARTLPRFVQRDLEQLMMATDARLDPGQSAIAPFLCGVGSDLPPALQGLSTLRGPAAEGESALVYVASSPSGRARRVVRLGRALAATRTTVLKQTRMKQGRTETTVAALLLAGPSGLPEEECFKAVYGFAFVPELHRGAFDVTLHRAREWLGELGAIERRAGAVTLATRRPLLCPDPRCSGSASDKILAALAEQDARSAKDIAELTGVPLRAVQATLAELVEDGACDARPGAGRAVEYFVEDTTFTEPTAVG